MKQILALNFFLFTLICDGQTPDNDSHWQLMWKDEFDSLNLDIWDIKNNVDHNSLTNYQELQVYTNRTENIFIDNGKLVIRAKNEIYSCPTTSQNPWECVLQYITNSPYDFTSAWVETKQAYNIQFGFIEAKIKLPSGIGLWPAFWTFTGNPSYQEIDIFEMTPGDEEYCHRNSSQHYIHTNNILTSNIHLQAPSYWTSLGNDKCDDPYASPSQSLIQDYTQWHTYGIEWSPSRIIWYLDNYPIRYYQNSGITASTALIFNLAIKRIGASYPADMLIDYVNIYQLKEDCSDYINTTTYDFSFYNNIEKNFINIGHGGGINSLVVGQEIKLRASQFIEMSGEFYVPVGASLYADANKDCSTDLGLDCTQTFNPCVFDFLNYDNSIKRKIELGGNECTLTITPAINNISFKATEEIHLNSGVTISPIPGKSVELKIVPCH